MPAPNRVFVPPPLPKHNVTAYQLALNKPLVCGCRFTVAIATTRAPVTLRRWRRRSVTLRQTVHTGPTRGRRTLRLVSGVSGRCECMLLCIWYAVQDFFFFIVALKATPPGIQTVYKSDRAFRSIPQEVNDDVHTITAVAGERSIVDELSGV